GATISDRGFPSTTMTVLARITGIGPTMDSATTITAKGGDTVTANGQAQHFVGRGRHGGHAHARADHREDAGDLPDVPARAEPRGAAARGHVGAPGNGGVPGAPHALTPRGGSLRRASHFRARSATRLGPGTLAQLVERCVHTAEVTGSS